MDGWRQAVGLLAVIHFVPLHQEIATGLTALAMT